MLSDLDFLPGLGKSDHVLISFHFNCYITPDFEGGAQCKYNFHKGNYESKKLTCRKLTGIQSFMVMVCRDLGHGLMKFISN